MKLLSQCLWSEAEGAEEGVACLFAHLVIMFQCLILRLPGSPGLVLCPRQASIPLASSGLWSDSLDYRGAVY